MEGVGLTSLLKTARHLSVTRTHLTSAVLHLDGVGTPMSTASRAQIVL